jgi:ribose transport system permease protein
VWLNGRKLWRIGWVRPLATLLFIVILATLFSPRTPEGDIIFWDARNLSNVLRQVSEIGILAVAMTLVIICGGIDLSVGSLLALSGVIFAHTFSQRGWPLSASMVTALAATTAFGLANGVIIARLRMQPFIVTLASMIGSRGFARWLVSNKTIDIGFGDDPIAQAVQFIAQRRLVVSMFFAVSLAGLIILNLTRFGRYIRAVGGSEEAARLSGIHVEWVKIRVYVLAGFLSGVAGILHCCQNHQGNAGAGVAYELDAIAAAVIGGTRLMGGQGGIFGTMVGTLVLGILSNLLGLNSVDENVQWMLKAAIIVAAVWLQSVGTARNT